MQRRQRPAGLARERAREPATGVVAREVAGPGRRLEDEHLEGGVGEDDRRQERREPGGVVQAVQDGRLPPRPGSGLDDEGPPLLRRDHEHAVQP